MALYLPKEIVVAEVGPRDGLQSFPRWIDTDTKVAMIDRLSDLGLPVIEVSNFAHPKVIPHLRDAEEVFERIKRRPGTVYRGLVPNARGAERAASAHVDEMLGLITISATYTRKNQNMTIDEAIAAESGVVPHRREAFDCPSSWRSACPSGAPMKGRSPKRTSSPSCAGSTTAASAASISPARSAWKTPPMSTACSGGSANSFRKAAFGFHIHNLSGMATANILAALDAGAAWLEGAICGIGGGIAMPTTLGSVGNFPTEDLVTMLAEMGVATGIDPERIVATVAGDRHNCSASTPQSHRGSGATRKNVAELATNNPNMRYS